MIEKNNLDKTNAWPFIEAKKILRERKKSIEKKKNGNVKGGSVTISLFFFRMGTLPFIPAYGTDRCDILYCTHQK